MSQRLTEATRFTVCYEPKRGEPEERFECRAPDRGSAIGELAKKLGHKDFVVTRVLPGWLPKTKPKKGNAPT